LAEPSFLFGVSLLFPFLHIDCFPQSTEFDNDGSYTSMNSSFLLNSSQKLFFICFD
jgi:hypothetical protein